MKRWNATLVVLCLTPGLLSVASGQSPVAEAPQATGLGPHRGRLLAQGGFQFEVVCSDRSVEIFAFDQTGQPVPLQNVRGRVVFASANDRRTYRYDLYAPGRDAPLPNRLYLAADLSHVPDRSVSVDVVLNGLARQTIEFATPFQRTLSRERVAILRQRVCPVSGKRLGSMGQPPKVTIGNRDIYVCCAGCETPLKKNPQLHLAKLASPAPAKATKADAVAIALQRTCPVMNEPLSSMGGPWKVMVDGQPVFVCCKGCIPKVQERPELYLTRVATTRSETLRR